MFNSYLKPGKGVSKNEKPRNGREQFFFVVGTNLRKLFFINIINLMAFVPLAIFLMCIKNELNISEGYSYIYDILSFVIIVVGGIAPISSGINYVMLLFAENEPFFASDIFDAIKNNIKQSIVVLIINIIAVYVFSVNYKFYFVAEMGSTPMKLLFYVAFILFLMINMYVYPLMLKYKLSVFGMYKKAFTFTLLLLPQNLVMLILISLFGALCFFLNTILGYALAAFVFFAFASLAMNIFTCRMIKKYSVS